MTKVLAIIGTRPEAIKMAPVIMALNQEPRVFETLVCATAQHRELLDQVLSIFAIVPDMDLDLMEPNQVLCHLTSRVLEDVSAVLRKVKPDLLMVQGDTTTVMAATLAAFYQKIPTAHVEAGLRTEDRYFPFPEEVNRRVTSVLASYHFAPTEKAKNNLLGEGFSKDRIFVTGNTVIDALYHILRKPRPSAVENLLPWGELKRNRKKLILVTAHRRENFGEPFEEICAGLKALAERNEEVVMVYPVHLNPNVREPVFRILKEVKGVHLLDPVEYDVMAHLMKEAHFIITDSGGIQEEAPSLGKPVLVLRTKTERPEALEAGVAKLIGPHADAIVREGETLLHDRKAYNRMAKVMDLYGDGKAAEKIVDVLKRNLA